MPVRWVAAVEPVRPVGSSRDVGSASKVGSNSRWVVIYVSRILARIN